MTRIVFFFYISLENSIVQFSQISKLPGFVKSIGLPDFHFGYCFPIGTVVVIDLEDPSASISPNGVGFDINCGVRCLKTNLFKKDLSDSLKEKIGDLLTIELPFDNIPICDQISLSEFNKIIEKAMVNSICYKINLIFSLGLHFLV